MDDQYQQANTREDFSAQRIADASGISTSVLFRLMREEWQKRFETLPTPRERVTRLVWQLVESNIPLDRFTRKHIYELVGQRLNGVKWFYELYRAAYLALLQRHNAQETPPPQSPH